MGGGSSCGAGAMVIVHENPFASRLPGPERATLQFANRPWILRYYRVNGQQRYGFYSRLRNQ